MSAQELSGVIDIHAHSGPDSIRRSIDAIELALAARHCGMSGLVFKNHFEPTASLAYLVRKAVPDIAVFGGITLNRAIGGMNACAVERMALVSGGWGRFVWMGSFDTEAQVRYEGSGRPYVKISEGGELLSGAADVLDVIAKHNLVLATGHCTPEEDLLLIREARKRGIRHIVVTHAMMAPIHMPVEQMREAADMGAYIEFVYNGLVGPHKEFELPDYAAAIRTIGPERCVLASDLGQAVNPLHIEGLSAFFAGLRAQGISQMEVDCMSKENPARLLSVH
ncbi:MAG TPA: DUF6282 family protein [Bryobacteraceae bacterium]|jgi:hypothetical protein|nr:DUF6282 family protein [Bryobacteraceae bacterium]